MLWIQNVLCVFWVQLDMYNYSTLLKNCTCTFFVRHLRGTFCTFYSNGVLITIIIYAKSSFTRQSLMFPPSNLNSALVCGWRSGAPRTVLTHRTLSQRGDRSFFPPGFLTDRSNVQSAVNATVLRRKCTFSAQSRAVMGGALPWWAQPISPFPPALQVVAFGGSCWWMTAVNKLHWSSRTSRNTDRERGKGRGAQSKSILASTYHFT